MSVETSGFTTEGHESFPNLDIDNGRVGELSLLAPEVLVDKWLEYTRFLQTRQLPRHQAVARRIMDHIAFEVGYQEGIYGTDL